MQLLQEKNGYHQNRGKPHVDQSIRDLLVGFSSYIQFQQGCFHTMVPPSHQDSERLYRSSLVDLIDVMMVMIWYPLLGSRYVPSHLGYNR